MEALLLIRCIAGLVNTRMLTIVEVFVEVVVFLLFCGGCYGKKEGSDFI